MKTLLLAIEWIFALYVLYHAFFKQREAAQPTETKDDQELSAISGHKSMRQLKKPMQEIKK